MLLTGEKTRVLQMHLTKQCSHGYSSSSPDKRGGLPTTAAKRAIHSAYELGYNTVSLCGGEPLLADDLPAIAREARSLGMKVNLVTDGMLLNESDLSELAPVLDAIAISLEGVPERHNRIRRDPNAFDKMRGNLRALRASRIPFEFLFTVSADNLFEMEWAAEFAHREGAKLLRVHPQPDTAIGSSVLASRLRQIYLGRMAIEVDWTTAAMPPISSSLVFELARQCASGESTLGHFLSPLVVEDSGLVVPLRYGFPRQFALGSVLHADLKDLAAVWARSKAKPLAALYRLALEQISHSGSAPLDLYEWLSSTANAAPIALSA